MAITFRRRRFLRTYDASASSFGRIWTTKKHSSRTQSSETSARQQMLPDQAAVLDARSPPPPTQPCRGTTFRTKFWTPAVKAAKVDQKVTFHNLRVAHASWLLAGCADIIVVQERLGHRRITTTQQHTGTLPDAGERALAAFHRIRYGDLAPAE